MESTVTEYTDLLKERSRLDDKLSRQWDWLDANPNHPQRQEREDVWERTLHKYEQVEDAISRIAHPS